MTDQMKMKDDFYIEADELITKEFTKAVKKFPDWPVNLFEGYAILAEETGELAKALIELEHNDGLIDDCIEEAAQAGAMCIRVLQRLLIESQNIEHDISMEAV